MLNKIKKIIILFELLCSKEVVIPVTDVLKTLKTKRIPDKVYTEVKENRILLPFNTILYLYNWLKYETITKMTDGRYVINSFLPPMPGKGYERMFENLLSGRKISPVSSYIAITSRCEYNCWHCSYKKRSHEDLTLEQIFNVIDQLVNIGTSIIGITGGEPTLRDDLVKIVNKASAECDCMLFTNGYNFNYNLASDLKNAGLWGVAVSLDSDVPQNHNEKRGYNNAFELAINAVELSKRLGFYTMITTVPDIQIINNDTYKRIYKLAQKLDVDEFRIVEPMPAGNLITCENCLIDFNQREKIKEFHKIANSKNLKPKVCSFALIESEMYFGCCAGTMHLFIDNSGHVCPCDFTPLSFGNIKNEPLILCWERMLNTFKLPRSKCFMLEYYQLIVEHCTDKLPLEYIETEQIMKKITDSQLPAYFKHVLSLNHSKD